MSGCCPSFVPAPAGASGGSTPVVDDRETWIYQVTGLEPDLSSFRVTLPVVRVDTAYQVQATFEDVTTFTAPPSVTDKTTIDFLASFGLNLTAGDKIAFALFELTYNPT